MAGGWRLAAGVMQAHPYPFGLLQSLPPNLQPLIRHPPSPTPYPLSSSLLDETGLEADLDTINPAIDLMIPID